MWKMVGKMGKRECKADIVASKELASFSVNFMDPVELKQHMNLVPSHRCGPPSCPLMAEGLGKLRFSAFRVFPPFPPLHATMQNKNNFLKRSGHAKLLLSTRIIMPVALLTVLPRFPRSFPHCAAFSDPISQPL